MIILSAVSNLLIYERVSGLSSWIGRSGHSGSQLIFNIVENVEATNSSHYSPKLGTTTMYFWLKK